MSIVLIRDFNLDNIAESGQCFRMWRQSDGAFAIVAGQRFLTIRELGKDRFEFSCSDEALRGLWANYFDLDTDYAAINEAVDETDEYLQGAIRFSRGLRILRQDPWEVAVSFILSQRKNIPAIRHCVESLCRRFGTPFETARGTVYAFPTPQQILKAAPGDLRACSLGYRDKYVFALARAVDNGEMDLDAIGDMDDTTAKSALMRAYGIGEKVANCILLFGYHRLSVFPVDVWIQRVLDNRYDGAFPIDRYQPFAGVMQQYLFYYARNAKEA